MGEGGENKNVTKAPATVSHCLSMCIRHEGMYNLPINFESFARIWATFSLKFLVRYLIKFVCYVYVVMRCDWDS